MANKIILTDVFPKDKIGASFLFHCLTKIKTTLLTGTILRTNQRPSKPNCCVFQPANRRVTHGSLVEIHLFSLFLVFLHHFYLFPLNLEEKPVLDCAKQSLKIIFLIFH